MHRLRKSLWVHKIIENRYLFNINRSHFEIVLLRLWHAYSVRLPTAWFGDLSWKNHKLLNVAVQPSQLPLIWLVEYQFGSESIVTEWKSVKSVKSDFALEIERKVSFTAVHHDIIYTDWIDRDIVSNHQSFHVHLFRLANSFPGLSRTPPPRKKQNSRLFQ